MIYPSKLVEQAVKEVSKLPSIGSKSALRLVLHMLKEDPIYTESLAETLLKLRTNIQYCKQCHSIADEEICNICASSKRDEKIVCVTEETKDVLAIENTGQFFGMYHVLGGVISPIEGISPADLKIESLVERIKRNGTTEIILALSSTMEGDTTAFYLSKKLKDLKVKITSIARGVPIGGELEYADEVTLGRSILSRGHYEG
jgi:recombination protein RecR